MISLSNFIIKDKSPLININQNISDALKQLNRIDMKTLFVVRKKGKKNYFCGTITDGDIRRFFIKKNNQEKKLKYVFRKKSKFLFQDDKNYASKVINIKEKFYINHIPIVTLKNNEYIGYIIADDVIKKNKLKLKKKNKFDLVIMAGGIGKRLRPLTYYTPKPLIEINGSTMISRIINYAKSYDVRNIYISLKYKGNLIKKFIENKHSDENIFYIRENKPLGTAGSLYQLKNKKNIENILLVNADISTSVDFNYFYDFHKKNKSDISMCSSIYEINIPYGVIENKESQVKKITEKPKLSFLINSGIYLINKKILKLIKNKTFLNATELISKAKLKKYRVNHYPMYEDWIDIGSKDDLLKARKKIR